MSKVDWSLAPEGATHYTYGSPDPWRDYSTNTAMYWSAIRKEWSKMCLRSSADCLNSDVPHEARPQPKPWSGPEDGLPPVGTVCEVREPNNYSAFEDWSKCTVSAHNIGSNGRPQVCAVDDRGDFAIFYPEIDPVEFRATPSSADLRETAIRDVMDIAQVDCRVTATRLVDAGFKREVV